jgi:hypothetical protein
MAEKVRGPLIGTAAAAGLAGAAALGTRALSHRNGHGRSKSVRRLRSAAGGIGKLGKEMGEAGFRLGVGDMDVEVRKAGNNSKARQSPLEALLLALTSRRSVK